MADICMDVDTALSEVPVNILPLIDDTDFKTIETSIAYNAAGMDLVWNFVTTAGAMTQTAVTPTTAGNYDWTNQGDGMYTIEIPASGGASINNDTEGFGWFTGVITGVLPFRGPVICFRAAGLNNALIDDAYSATRGLAGTALPAAAADAAGGLPISDAGGLDLDTRLGYLTANVATASALTTAQNDLDILTGTDGVTLATSQPNYAPYTGTPPTVSEIADGVWDESTTGHVSAGSFGRQVKTLIDDILEDTGTTIPATLSTMDGKLDTIDGIVDAILLDTGTTLPAQIAALNDISPAQVNAEVLDVLATDTFPESSSVVAATASLKDSIVWLRTLARNKITQTATTQTLRNDADSGNIASSSVSDDGTTFTRGEFA